MKKKVKESVIKKFIVFILDGFRDWNYYFKNKYKRNLESNELHLLSNITGRCNADKINHYELLTEYDENVLILSNNINYCEHCKGLNYE
jgi:hypothetical protein